MCRNDIEITYRNDYVFKTTLKGDDDDSKYLLKFLIEAITGVKYQEVRVTNGELLGEYISAKNSYLDIKAIDMEGNLINIEMQQSYINQLQRKRVQFYGCRTVTAQPIKGERYDKLNKVEQIVFTSERFNNQLYSRFTLRESNGNELEDNLITYHIISLPFIKEIYKRKKVENESLNDLEVLSYAYYFMIDNDIINISNERQKKVLEIMKKKREYILDDEKTYDIARAIAYANAAQDADIETAHEIGIREGYESGKELGFKNGLETGYRDGHESGFKDGHESGFKDGHELGYKDGHESGIIDMLVSYIHFKFNQTINLSYLSKERLDILKNEIYTLESFEDLKQLIEKE